MRRTPGVLAKSIAAVVLPALVAALSAGAPIAADADGRSASTAGAIHHDLKVRIDPAAHRLRVEDAIALPPELIEAASAREASLGKGADAGSVSVVFLLHAGLGPVTATPGASLERVPGSPERSDVLLGSPASQLRADAPVERFRALLPAGSSSITIVYEGTIDHPLPDETAEYARGFRETPGTITADGVYLAGSTVWYPWFGDGLVTFSLAASLPEGWESVSQGVLQAGSDSVARASAPAGATAGNETEAGARAAASGPNTAGEEGASAGNTWTCTDPQQEIFLIAGRFTRTVRQTRRAQAIAYLRIPDESMAGRYLDATGQYLEMYSNLLGAYPYGKFALVENFWETGYGMPSFTLLGPKVIRLPFILRTSYPHEILHNWWGNSVYVREGTGNWSEGLTADLSDHLAEEQQGRGAEYRQTTLQKYADYVTRGKDFPLTEFTSRHSPATEAVGYGKAMMMFHMLRLDLGDERFTSGLRGFYKANRFRPASYADLRAAFEQAGGASLTPFFSQWTTRPGAPALKIGEMRTVPGASASGAAARPAPWMLELTLEQTQSDAAWSLNVPLAVTMEGRTAAWQGAVAMGAKRQTFTLPLPARPLRVDVDPEFDLFRALDRGEIPPALSQAFGADKPLILLPSAEKDRLEQYRALAEEWKAGVTEGAEIRLDSEIKSLPAKRSVWLFGWDNRFRDEAAGALAAYGASIGASSAAFAGASIPRAGHSAALTVARPREAGHVLGWIAADPPAAIPGLGRKLPHYHKYSYLAFEGDEPVNTVKGRWPVVASPMTAFVKADGASERAARGTLAPRSALAELPPLYSKDRMLETVRALSAQEMQGRGFGSPELERAAQSIAAAFKDAGLQPGGEGGGFFQSFTAQGGDPARSAELRNVIGVVRGTKSEWAEQSVVVCAHYDHLGFGWPDARAGNAGKVHPGADDNASGVAVLLELARQAASQARPERSIVFIAFAGEEAGRLGSKHYVGSASAYPAAKCLGAVNLDTVGRLGSGKLLILGAGSAKEWVHIFNGAGYVTGVPLEVVAADAGSSDQKSFLNAGVPAVQIFSGPNLDYHAPTDTFDKIDGDGMVKVAQIAGEAVAYLAGRDQPMTAAGAAPGGAAPGESPGGAPAPRRVSLGTVPDFAYQGSGVRISAVTPGSPAEKAGLRSGDVIVGIGSAPVADLKAFSEFLKASQPGQKVTVRFLRDGRGQTVDAELAAR